MNNDIFVGKWEEIEGQMRQAWGKFTDDDFQQLKGAQQEIYGKLQKHYGYSKDQAEKAVQDFKNKYKP